MATLQTGNSRFPRLAIGPLTVSMTLIAGSLAVCVPAFGVFTGLYVHPHTTIETPLGPRTVWRVYANFSEGADQVMSWGGTENVPLMISTKACSFELGGNFYNSGGITAPWQEAIDKFPLAQWDTFATIGVSIADQGSNLPPLPSDGTTANLMPPFIPGNQLSTTTGTIFLQVAPGSPAAAQGRADYAGDGDPLWRVLLGQFTTPVGDGISVKIGELRYQSAAGNFVTLHNVSNEIADATGRCCLPDGSCSFTNPLGCIWGNGTFIGCEPCTSCPPPKPPCAGDVSPSGGDGEVNVQDMLAVINAWGACPAPCAMDLNSDGTVNVADLLGVINAWGPCE